MPDGIPQVQNLCWEHLPKGVARQKNQQLVNDVSLCDVKTGHSAPKA